VGLKVDEPLSGRCHLPYEKLNCPQGGETKPKRRNNEERKEKAKDAARNRRTEESDYFEELEKLLPVTGPPPSSQQTTLDKTSVIRLSVAQLKTQDVLQNGLAAPMVKDEVLPGMDILSCLDGFSLVLGSSGDIIYVSDNVNSFIGLYQVELLGQDFCDYVHPCDHKQLQLLTQNKPIGMEEEAVEIFVRVKCTVTERGRMINLKQANYKPLKISGKVRHMPEKEEGGVKGAIFLGMARSVLEREVLMDHQIGVFTSKHSVDMKIMETDNWMASVAGYSFSTLIGSSFFELVHALDIVSVQKAFKNLKEHGQCETCPYRLLCYTGGYAWVQTKACLATARRGCNKGQTISCSHQQISEVMNREEILSIIQMKTQSHVPFNTQVAQPQVISKEILKQVGDGDAKMEVHSQAAEPIQYKMMKESMYNIEINIPTKQKSVIIEPRKVNGNGPPISIAEKEKKKPLALQTSVIVKCRKQEDECSEKTQNIQEFQKREDQNLKAATNNMFQIGDPAAISALSICTDNDPIYDTEEFATIALDQTDANTPTDGLWVDSDDVAIVNELVYNIEKPTQTYLENNNVIETFSPITNIKAKDQIEEKEYGLFNNLFQNQEGMEKYSPHYGENCVTLDRKDPGYVEETGIKTFSFDDLIMLDFDDNFGLVTDFMIPNNEPIFDKNQILIDPHKNTMWGSCGEPDQTTPKAFDVFDHDRITTAASIWKEFDGGKGNNVGDTFGRKSNGMLDRDEKHIFVRDSGLNVVEPPTTKPVCRPKADSFKRSYVSQSKEQYSMSKRFKPSNFSMTNHIGYSDMDLRFDNHTTSDIDVVTVN